MTAKRKKLLLLAVACVLGGFAVLTGVSVLIMQTRWFADFVRAKTISVLEDSTGAKVEIRSFRFEPGSLTVVIEGLVLHGTEPVTAKPLATLARLELHLKLFAGLHQAIDLAYLGAEQPSVNLLVNPDGSTNIPAPKVKRAASSKSPLATVVDLAIGKFQLEQGFISYLQQTTPFSLRGDNLRILLNFNALAQNYVGNINIAPVNITQGKNAPIAVAINLPITIQRDGLKLTNARLSTATSQIDFDAGLENLNAPEVTAKAHAKLSFVDLQNALNVPFQSPSPRSPGFATADLDGSFDQAKNTANLRTLHVVLGSSTVTAAGALDPSSSNAIKFNGDFVLGELSRFLKVSTPQISGSLHTEGQLTLDSARRYTINGTLDSRALSVQSGATKLTNVSLSSPYQITPNEISLNPIHLSALGGTLNAKVLIEQMKKFSGQGELHDISISALTSAFAGHPIQYGAAISGSVSANSDLDSRPRSDLFVKANLRLSPTKNGVPVNGLLEATYAASNDAIAIKSNSFISFPNSRLDLAGPLSQDLKVTLISHNLNDFLPAANFGSEKPATQLPVTLRGGVANLEAHIKGGVDNPHLTANAVMTNFAASDSLFDRLSFNATASSSGVAIQNGLLARQTLQTNFDGSVGLVKWAPTPRSSLSANLTIRNAGLDSLVAIANASYLPASGNLNADIHLNGTYGDPLGAGTIQISDGKLYGQPFSSLEAQINASQGLIRLSHFDVATAGGHFTAQANFHHPLDDMASGRLDVQVKSNGIQLAQVNQLQQNGVNARGALDLTGDAIADLIKTPSKETELKLSAVEANFAAQNLSVRDHQAGNLTASAHTTAGAVQYNVTSNFSGSNINVNGHTSLSHGYYTEAAAAVRNLSLKDVLDVSGYTALPVKGMLTAQASFSGTAQAPDAKGNLQISNANIYQEPINKLTADFRYTNALAEITSFDLDLPAGHITLTGRYDQPVSSTTGSLKLNIPGADLQMSKVHHLQVLEPGIAGTLHLAADAAATLSQKGDSSSLLLSALNADATAQGVRVAGRNAGNLKFSAHTAQSKLTYELDSDLAQSRVHASGDSQLIAGYPSHLGLTFSNVRYGNIAPFLATDEPTAPLFDVLIEGKASASGMLQDFNSVEGRLELGRFDLNTVPPRGQNGASTRTAPRVQNEGPLVVTLNKSVVTIDQFHLRGPKTSVDLSGAANLVDNGDALRINVNANSDLGVLEDVNHNFFSSGAIAVNAIVGGTFSAPVMNGRVELHNANINYADAPNGLSNGEGVILLSGKTATIQNLTGESGGGKIAVDGFIGLSPRAVVYNLHATAARVRTRYNSLSIVSNANLRLSGSSLRSLLSGKVVVQKITYSSSSDIGSMLTSAAAPPATEGESSPALSTMRLDIGVSTASDLRVVTTYVDKLELNSNLQVRGTAANPGMLGYINIADGQLTFFGNSYTINKGAINFYDSSSVRPELNFSLETVAQGVDVVLGVSGPMNDMKLSYRSDPPLTFEQIVQLLATNTTPFDPTIAAHQPSAPQQSASQMGESAVLGQAIANPLASRVQRVFGLSQFKIDPSVAGSNGQPSAKVTLQQKIASNITFTYITDVTQSNSEIVRIQLDLGPKVSAVGLRDYNGNVSVELFYKFQKK